MDFSFHRMGHTSQRSQGICATSLLQHSVSRRAIADLQSFPCPTTLVPLGLWPNTGRAPCCPWAGSWSGCWSGAHHGRNVRARWGQAKTQLSGAAGGCARLGQARSSGTGASRGHSDTIAHPPDRALRWGTGPPPKPCSP